MFLTFLFRMTSSAKIERSLRAKRAKEAAKIGEPWISHFEPASLVKELTAIGFSRASSLGAQEANQRYFADREDGFSVRGSGQIMTAYV